MAVNPLALNGTTPAAPAGAINCQFQAATPDPNPSVLRNTSVYLPKMTATAPGAVPTPPNDATKYLDGTGNFSAPAGGGGGGGIYPAMTVPPSSAFTWENQGGAAVADKTARMAVSMPDSYPSVVARGLFKNLPYSPPYTLDVACSMSGVAYGGNGNIFYLALRDGSGNWVAYGLNWSQSNQLEFRRDKWSSDGTTFVGSATPIPLAAPTSALLWLRIIDDGTNRMIYTSANGQDWSLILTESNTTDITPTQIGVAFYNNSGESAGYAIPAKFSVYNFVATASALPDVGN